MWCYTLCKRPVSVWVPIIERYHGGRLQIFTKALPYVSKFEWCTGTEVRELLRLQEIEKLDFRLLTCIFHSMINFWKRTMFVYHFIWIKQITVLVTRYCNLVILEMWNKRDLNCQARNAPDSSKLLLKFYYYSLGRLNLTRAVRISWYEHKYSLHCGSFNSFWQKNLR